MSAVDERAFWAWGANNCGQLGIGNCEDRLLPTLVLLSAKATDDSGDASDSGRELLTAVQIGGGGAFSFVVTASGQVLTCGKDDRGQLGQSTREESKQHPDHSVLTSDCQERSAQSRSDKQQTNTSSIIEETAKKRKPQRPDVLYFSRCSLPSDLRIKHVAAGWDFMLALSENGTIHSWGSNSFGQLGRESELKWDAQPKAVSCPDGNKFVAVAAGLRHGLAISDRGQLYSWGSGRNGQLGVPVTSSPIPLCVDLPDHQTLVQVSGGMNVSVVLTEQGSVLLFGCNKFGQCGVDPGDAVVVKVPRKLEMHGDLLTTGGSRVVSVAAGWTHVVARTDCGAIYTWGRSDLGQLGRQVDVTSGPHRPGKVEGIDGRVTSHCCSSEHSLALTENGTVYAWGWNEHGICGTGDESNIHRPHCLSINKAVRIGCGAGHCFCLQLLRADNKYC